ncbi:hypothetical protein [Runella sp.]|jgi:hypothetical protein|uniref:hypothetical protein n=1 Tax=Runella sp. TaxID=1960881 RepID=UPI0026117D75|nr:hypothetical protein [Runella sp.]
MSKLQRYAAGLILMYLVSITTIYAMNNVFLTVQVITQSNGYLLRYTVTNRSGRPIYIPNVTFAKVAGIVQVSETPAAYQLYLQNHMLEMAIGTRSFKHILTPAPRYFFTELLEDNQSGYYSYFIEYPLSLIINELSAVEEAKVDKIQFTLDYFPQPEKEDIIEEPTDRKTYYWISPNAKKNELREMIYLELIVKY